MMLINYLLMALLNVFKLNKQLLIVLYHLALFMLIITCLAAVL